MQVWVALFVILIGTAQVFEWVQHLILPLPAMVVAGILLAIASNAPKRPKLAAPQSSASPLPAPAQAQPAPPQPASPTPPITPELPRFNQQTPPQKSISFTIRKNSNN